MRTARAVADRGTRRSSPLLVVNVSVLATVSTFPARSTAPPLKVHELGATEASVDREHDKVGEPVSRPRLGTDGRHDPVDLILGQEPGELGRDASEPDTVGRHDVRKPLILRPTEEDLEGPGVRLPRHVAGGRRVGPALHVGGGDPPDGGLGPKKADEALDDLLVLRARPRGPVRLRVEEGSPGVTQALWPHDGRS